MYLAILRVIASMLRREHEVEGGRVGSWCGSKRGAAVRGELRYAKKKRVRKCQGSATDADTDAQELEVEMLE